ncbi:MAG: hypothetical protein B5M51_05490 [Anaerolinea sp. 4484_236]|nr:MAG: hypothetical protein B5M51_05490 [Anaerolinea sp. 4484_236]RLD08174.1 MAG: hypothetical protein DRI56_05830 [Chloroflexota bacterium]
MPISIVLHIKNTEPILGEIDELPQASDNIIKISNPRQRDGKDLVLLQHNVVTVFWPIETINFIEILPGEEEEEILSFVRE